MASISLRDPTDLLKLSERKRNKAYLVNEFQKAVYK